MLMVNQLIGFGVGNVIRLVTVGGTFTASSAIGTLDPEDAFDGLDTSCWTSSGTEPQWLQAQLTTSAVVKQYQIVGYDTGNANSTAARAPRTWTLRGSTDNFSGSDVVLDTQTAVAAWSDGEVRTYDISNTTSYSYYRINVTDGQDGSATFINITDLWLWGY